MRIAVDTHPKESRYLQPIDPATGEPFRWARALDTDEGWLETYTPTECTCKKGKCGMTHLTKGPFGGPLVTRTYLDFDVVDRRTGKVVEQVRQVCQTCGQRKTWRPLLTSTFWGCLC